MKNISEFVPKHYREWGDMLDFVNELKKMVVPVWSWGAEGWKEAIKKKLLQFKVNGKKHKGYVYIAVNGSDYFDIWLTDLQGNVVKEFTDIDLFSVVDTIDGAVET